MAWAAQRSDGVIISVGFDPNQAPHDPDVQILQVAEAVAMQVLEGSLNLQHVISGPPPLQARPATDVSRALGNSAYPSMMRQVDIDALCALSKFIATDGIAVEIGSRLGGGAKIILDHAPAIKRLYCIDCGWSQLDLCSSDPALSGIVETHGIDPSTVIYDYARSLLSNYPMARLLPMHSPNDLSWWKEPVDFVFEDSSHANPQLRDSLQFWLPLVKSGGIISGHDYIKTWPDVITEADALAAQLGAELHTAGSIWWIIKP